MLQLARPRQDFEKETLSRSLPPQVCREVKILVSVTHDQCKNRKNYTHSYDFLNEFLGQAPLQVRRPPPGGRGWRTAIIGTDHGAQQHTDRKRRHTAVRIEIGDFCYDGDAVVCLMIAEEGWAIGRLKRR